MIISHVKLSLLATGYFRLLEMTVVYIINRKIHGFLKMADLFRLLKFEHDISDIILDIIF